jgi:hypothetical protein
MKKTRQLLCFILIGVTVSISAEPITWHQMPLRTQAQKDAGLKGGEGFQMIWGMSYAPSNPDTVYLIVDKSQVWKSTDGGNNWTMKHTGFKANGGTSLVVDPTNEDVVYVAGCVHTIGETEPEYYDKADGIYRTLDGGDSWSRVCITPFLRLEGVKIKGCVNFCFDPNSASSGRLQTIYCGTHTEGIMKSTNGGDDWYPLGLSGLSLTILDIKIKPTDSNSIYVTTDDGLFKITVNTSTVTQIGTGLPTGDSNSPTVININPNNPDIMYASCGTSGIYKSTDGGNTFSSCNTGISANHLGSKSVCATTMSPANPNYLMTAIFKLGGQNIYYTHNGGANWYLATTIDEDGLAYDIAGVAQGEFWGAISAFHPTNETIALIAGHGSHIERTENGGSTWRYCGDGYTGGCASGAAPFAFDMTDPDTTALFLYDFGFVKTVNNGDTFKNMFIGGTTHAGAIDPTNGNRIVTAAGGWNDQTINVSTDGGENWTPKTSIAPYGYKFIAFHPQKPTIVYADKFRSWNSGDDWSELSYPVATMFQGNADIVYAKTAYGAYNTEILKSMDCGATWLSPYDLIPTGVSSVRAIAVDPTDSDRLYVATNYNGLYIWNGTNWESKGASDGIDLAFENYYLSSVVVDPVQPNVIYCGQLVNWVGQTNGAFRSLDYGNSWTNITDELAFSVDSLGIDPRNQTLYLGSFHGTWRMSPLAGHWAMDEDGGVECRDGSMYRNHGGINGADYTDGISGVSALTFNGGTDYVDCGNDPSLDVTGDMTVSAWIYARSAPIGEGRTVASRYTYPESGWNFGLQWGSGTSFMFNVYDGMGGSATAYDPDFFSLELNKWKYVVGVYKPDEYVKLYVDGELMHTCTGGVPSSIGYAAANNHLVIGSRPNGQSRFDGVIDEVKIYKRALSDAEITYEYHKVGRALHWKFDESDGEILAIDSSDQANHGLITGSGIRIAGPRGNAVELSKGETIQTATPCIPHCRDEITVGGWVKVVQDGSAMNSFIFSKSNSYRLISRWSRATEFGVYINGSYYATDPYTIPVGCWIHIAGTYNAADQTLNLYVNGTLQKSRTLSGLFNYKIDSNQNDGKMEMQGDADRIMQFDDIRVYAKALTQTEINDIKNSQ